MEQENKKLKISVFDVIIVLLVAAAAFAVFAILKPKDVKVAAPTTVPTEFTVELVQVPKGAADLIQPGDAVRDSTRNYDIGTVVSHEVLPYTAQVADEENLTVKNVVLDRYDNILLTIQSNMLTGGSALTTESGYQITVGTKVYLAGPCYAGTGYVIAIDRGDAE